MDTGTSEEAEPFRLTTSPGFADWLASRQVSLALTTYQAGKLFLIGLTAGGRLAVFERTFPRCMGLAVSADARTLLLATRHQILRLDDALAPGETWQGRDALYCPRAAWYTGDLDAHDIGFGPHGRPVFANTLFSCLATVADGHSFRPLWTPPGITALAPEDRCHLNGVAFRDGAATHVTLAAASDVREGWRAQRAGGGCLVEVTTGRTLLDGLSMPHSPRWQVQDDGSARLWLLDSGSGRLGWLDPEAGCFQPVAFCPGYARGLAFAGDDALVGLSCGRERADASAPAFAGLPLDAALAACGLAAACGVEILDTRTGNTVAWLRIAGVVRELFDVAVLPGIVNPALIGLRGEEIDRVLTIAPGGEALS